jgi:hypothetical protein
LRIDGTAVTGFISMSLGPPMPIVRGTASGDTVTFVVNSSEGARTVTFTGSLDGDQLQFTRDVVANFQAGGGDGIVGSAGVKRFTARRASSFPPSNTTAVTPARSPATSGAPLPSSSSGSGPGGRWQVTNVPNAPWIFEFRVAGTSLSGTVQQNGIPSDPVTIAAGKGSGSAISFKALSPDAERLITFTGQLTGNEISFTREVTPIAGGGRGDSDLYGAPGPTRFIATRAASTGGE